MKMKFFVLFFFLTFFALYLHTCSPHVAPYRDAGEMASLLGTLGVAHPPGYPLYTLLGRCALFIPLGNLVYRANFFSSACAAGALVFLFLTLRSQLSFVSSVLAVFFFAFSNPFWELSAVSEMYALGVLWVAFLFYVTFVLENLPLFALLMALGLGARMDMLLLVPVFLVWFGREKMSRTWKATALFFGLGATVFLYLMIRSRTDPLIDWGSPDTLVAVFNSATRKSYSGTLDLLSLSYKKGENFFVNLEFFGSHMVKCFSWWGVVLLLFGVVTAWKKNKKLAFFWGAVFLITGPLFLFLANMPPNPHALAIVEASFLIPDLVLVCLIGFGAELLLQMPFKFAISTAVGCLLVLNAFAGYARASKRENYFARDYIENVWRSVPRDSVAVFHKDVQLFSLWASQLLEKRRPDVSLVATGLSGSPWYWEMMRRWKTASCPEVSLKEPKGWSRLRSAIGNRPLVVGPDVELGDADGVIIQPRGLVFSLIDHEGPLAEDASFLLPNFCLYRGHYLYGDTQDFFSTDLIGDHARAHHQQGLFFLLHGNANAGEWFLERAESLDPTFWRASADRAYLHFIRGDFASAYGLYRIATKKSQKTLELAIRYKSLPAVMAGCRTDLSTAYTQWGATAEKLGRMDEARECYAAALNVQETAQAHYNLAVTYWGRDWNQVIVHMRRALEINPQMSEARNYLAKAEMISHGK